MMDLIAAQFGDRCEVVLHDLSGDYENTIVAIRNGHISGRHIGGTGSNLGLEVLRGALSQSESDKYRYLTRTKDGKLLSCSTTYFRNAADRVIGAMCINVEITDIIMAHNVLKSMTFGYGQEVREVLVKDTYELFDYLMEQAQEHVGKPVSLMQREDKLNFVRYLDEHGAFLIKKAGERVCDYLDISKTMLYSVLNESRDDA